MVSPWSDPLEVVVELDSDGDGLSDNIEMVLGSDSSEYSDVQVVVIELVTDYIVTSDVGLLFYNSTSGNNSFVGSYDNGLYLLDDDCEGSWNYVYDPSSDSLTQYEESSVESSFEIPWFWVTIGGIIGVVVLVLIVLFKMGVIYFYDEYVVEE